MNYKKLAIFYIAVTLVIYTLPVAETLINRVTGGALTGLYNATVLRAQAAVTAPVVASEAEAKGTGATVGGTGVDLVRS